MNRRFNTYIASILVLASCQRIEDPYAGMFEQGIVFRVEENTTKAVKAITLSDLSTIYVSTTGSSSFTNATFTKSGSTFVGNPKINWPQTDPGYKFLASNVTMSSGSVTLSSGNSTDVVCAYNASPTYKETNNLAFKHILTRINTVSKGSYANGAITVSSVQLKNYGNSGTYSISGDSWSGIGTTTSTLACDGSNIDLWFIPGTYTLSITYTDATGSSSTRTVNQKFEAGVYYDITCTADDSAKPVIEVTTEYDTPTFDSTSSFSVIPAAGGSAGPVSVSNVKQKRRTTYKYYDGTTSAGSWETFSPSSYTVHYSKDNSSYGTTPLSYEVPSLLDKVQDEETSLGYLYTRVIANGKTSDTHSVEVRQQKNVVVSDSRFNRIESVDWGWSENDLGSAFDDVVTLVIKTITTISGWETKYTSNYVKKTASPRTAEPDETTHLLWSKRILGDDGAHWMMYDEPYIGVYPNENSKPRSWIFEVKLDTDDSEQATLLTPVLRQDGEDPAPPSKFSVGFKVNGTVVDDYGADWEGVVDHIELLDKDGKSIKTTGTSSGYIMFEEAGTSIRIYISEIKINSTGRFRDYNSWKNVMLPEAHCDAHFIWSDPSTSTTNGVMAISANGSTLTDPGVVITINHNMDPTKVKDGCLCNISFQ